MPKEITFSLIGIWSAETEDRAMPVRVAKCAPTEFTVIPIKKIPLSITAVEALCTMLDVPTEYCEGKFGFSERRRYFEIGTSNWSLRYKEVL